MNLSRERRAAMLDRSIPYYNIIMKKDTPTTCDTPVLPPQFELHSYRPDVAQQWAELEYEIGDYPSVQEASAYFAKTYLGRPGLLAQRGVFVSDKNSGCLVGACIAWFDDQNGTPVSSLHWLITKEAYQGRGIGSALIAATLSIYEQENAFPVYLHTQPWSYQAVWLYHKLGFRLMKQESFAGYENQYALAVPVLARYIESECMRELMERSE